MYIVAELPSDGDLRLTGFDEIEEANELFYGLRDSCLTTDMAVDSVWSDADGIEAGFESLAGDRFWKLKVEST